MEGIVGTNVYDVPLSLVRAHGGEGEIGFARVAAAGGGGGGCNFVDVAVLAPGTSIGRHRHAADEEEFYLVLAGSGTMTCEGRDLPIWAGDLVRNPPGGEHGLRNTGDEELRLFVFEIHVGGSA